MNIDEAFPSKYLKAADIPEGEVVSLVIEEIRIEEVGREKQERPIIYFKDQQKGFCCNKTNANTIKKQFGPDTDDWIGKTVRLYSTEVEFGGEMVESIRVKLKPGSGSSKPASVNQGPDDPQDDLPVGF